MFNLNSTAFSTFTSKDLFQTYDFSKLKKLDQSVLKACNHAKNKNVLGGKLFARMFGMIIKDIIENNCSFQLPTNKRIAYIQLKAITGDMFIKMYQNGSFNGLDFLASNYTGYEFIFRWMSKDGWKEKPIYPSTFFTQELYQKINNYQFPEGGTLKTVNDYLPKLQELYPAIFEEDLKKLVLHAWRDFYQLTCKGADFKIRWNNEFFYIGHILSNSDKMHDYIYMKRKIKMRLTYIRKKIEYDGYLYFRLNQEDYGTYITAKEKKKRKIILQKIILYKVPEEILCVPVVKEQCYFFKIAMSEPKNNKFMCIEENMNIADAVYLGKKDKQGILNYINEDEKRCHKYPYRRHSDRLYRTKHT